GLRPFDRNDHQVLLRDISIRIRNKVDIFILGSKGIALITLDQLAERQASEIVDRATKRVEDEDLNIILVQIRRQEQLTDLLTDWFLAQKRTHDPGLDKSVLRYFLRGIVQKVFREYVTIDEKRTGKPELTVDLLLACKVLDAIRPV